MLKLLKFAIVIVLLGLLVVVVVPDLVLSMATLFAADFTNSDLLFPILLKRAFELLLLSVLLAVVLKGRRNKKVDA